MMRNRETRLLTRTTAVFFALLLFLVPISLLAQDQDPDVGQRGEEVLDRLEIIIADGRSIREKQATASAEDSLVLRLQLARARDRFMEALDELADIVTATKGDDTHRLMRERAEDVYENVTPQIWKLIRELRLKIDELRAKRPDTPAAERLALETELAVLGKRLDSFFKIGWDHI